MSNITNFKLNLLYFYLVVLISLQIDLIAASTNTLALLFIVLILFTYSKSSSTLQKVTTCSLFLLTQFIKLNKFSPDLILLMIVITINKALRKNINLKGAVYFVSTSLYFALQTFIINPYIFGVAPNNELIYNSVLANMGLAMILYFALRPKG